jgi:thiol-disulfide isomerase/thioredoxin
MRSSRSIQSTERNQSSPEDLDPESLSQNSCAPRPNPCKPFCLPPKLTPAGGSENFDGAKQMSVISTDRRRFLGNAVMTIAAAQFGMIGCANAQSSAPVRLPSEGGFPSLSGATGWLNPQPLTAAGLRGKVVLVDFWTYTCVNWRRTLPYLRAWSLKYKDHGLVVIGVHTPEFSFEHNVDNIRWAIKDMKIEYPVAIDTNYAIWNAFNNEYWPAAYFIDAKGHIRHHQFGEGEYQQSEAVIQQLLDEAGSSGFDHDPVSVDASGAEVAADLGSLRTPETYVGDERSETFASPGGARLNKSRVYAVPPQLDLNHWALSGDWTVGKEAIVLNQANGRIAYRFHARDLNLVMGPAVPGKSVRFRLLLDGQTPGASHGTDVDGQSNGTIVEQRLYQLIRQPEPIADRQFEIEFLDPRAEAYDFTFG